MPMQDTKTIAYFDSEALANLKDGDIIFFDELLNGNPTTLNACLTLLEQRKLVSGTKLKNVMIVAAANPQNAAPTSPQIKERFVYYKVKYNEEMWMDFMRDKYTMPDIISKKLSHLIKKEKFENDNFFTPRSIDKMVDMMLSGVPVPTKYKNALEPILNTELVNTLEEDVVDKGVTIKPGEKFNWFEIFKLK